jgi:hypothetical protein
MPESGWQRWRAKIILAMLYAFFKLTIALSQTGSRRRTGF